MHLCIRWIIQSIVHSLQAVIFFHLHRLHVCKIWMIDVQIRQIMMLEPSQHLLKIHPMPTTHLAKFSKNVTRPPAHFRALCIDVQKVAGFAQNSGVLICMLANQSQI